VLAGGVEGSKFCLFSVVLPAKCVSSISPRFHYRRLAFCFLLLAAILKSPCALIFISFQETFYFFSYFCYDLLIIEQCIIQPPIICIFSAVIFVVEF
jgi:hypothetical protein